MYSKCTANLGESWPSLPETTAGGEMKFVTCDGCID